MSEVTDKKAMTDGLYLNKGFHGNHNLVKEGRWMDLEPDDEWMSKDDPVNWWTIGHEDEDWLEAAELKVPLEYLL